MFRTVNVHVEGIAPLLMHNGRLANPLDPYAKRLKELTAKRKKTDADHEAIALAEWEGGLYLNEKHQPIIPGENIEAAIVSAAKKHKLGPLFKASVFSDGCWVLKHDGPKSLEALRDDERFHDMRGVRVTTSRVMRARPIFRRWELTFGVSYDDDDVNPSQMEQMLQVAGKSVGLGDYRPKFGRFRVVSIKPAG